MDLGSVSASLGLIVKKTVDPLGAGDDQASLEARLQPFREDLYMGLIPSSFWTGLEKAVA